VSQSSWEQPEGEWTHDTLPRPFIDATRDAESMRAIARAYEWHRYLRSLTLDGDVLGRAADIMARGEVPEMLNKAAVSDVLALVESYGVDLTDLAEQLRAAAEMRTPVRISDAAELDRFVDQWTAAHARVIGAIGGVGGYSWQRSLIGEISRGFFLTGSLMTIAEDLNDGHVFFPLSDAEGVGMSQDDLFRGRMTDGVRRFLWKQTVRARDSFAQSQRLIDDLERKPAAAFRRWWFASLEILNQIEKNGFDVWHHPPKLSLYHRSHVRFQARFGRTTFR
jgi:phytoene/squalene synthetase